MDARQPRSDVQEWASRASSLEWRSDILRRVVEDLCMAGGLYNSCQDDFARQFKKTLVEQLRTKGIIGCTMTGAAKFAEDARAASPDVSLVEEVLENRVVTAQLNKTASQNDSRWGPQVRSSDLVGLPCH
ncbi:hypothetical protein BKA83DRAFT_4340538 [Pisolithus microcarpus]|nr:hypothetical protein BKA83DRAFT_4340538 [Pisolithus microcarpus]